MKTARLPFVIVSIVIYLFFLFFFFSHPIVSAASSAVVNHGDRPVKIGFTSKNGSLQTVTVSPGESLPVPPGTVRVERDMNLKDNWDAKSAEVSVVSGDQSISLSPVINNTPVVVSADGSGNIRPAAERVTAETSSSIAKQSGKNLVNYGKEPVSVEVIKANGSKSLVTIPPETSMALPHDAVQVNRDMNMKINKDSENARVQIAGDGCEGVDVTGVGQQGGVVLEPERPGVVLPASGNADDPEIREREGKSIVNHSEKPIAVNITSTDGTVKTVVIPPGKNLAVPAGTSRVERDMNMRINKDAGETDIRIAGDGTESELGESESGAISLDPSRPEIVRSSIEDSGKAGDGSFTGRDGKSVINYGDKPVAVDVTTADGRVQRITVPASKSLLLPPGTTRVERDMNSRMNKDAENVPVMIAGDGIEAELSTERSSLGVDLDPEDPSFVDTPEKEIAPQVSKPCGALFAVSDSAATVPSEAASSSGSAFKRLDLGLDGPARRGMDTRNFAPSGESPEPAKKDSC